MAEIDLTQFEGHTAGPWFVASTGGYKVAAIATTGIYADVMPDDDLAPDARLIAAAPALLAEARRQAAEIERLRGALAKARDGLSCGLWDYGPGQSEHDQCDELIAEIDEIIKDQK